MTALSPCSTSAPPERRVARQSSCIWPCSMSWRTAGSSGCRTSSTPPTPSKPPGCGRRAMSQENVDRFVEGIEAFNRNDIEGVLRGMDPEVKFEHRLADLQGKFVGVEAVRGWFADLDDYFEPGRIDCSDIRDLGERVLALGTVRAIGRESGVATELPYTVVATFKDGRITHFTDFADREKALEAAGLRE